MQTESRRKLRSDDRVKTGSESGGGCGDVWLALFSTRLCFFSFFFLLLFLVFFGPRPSFSSCLWTDRVCAELSTNARCTDSHCSTLHSIFLNFPILPSSNSHTIRLYGGHKIISTCNFSADSAANKRDGAKEIHKATGPQRLQKQAERRRRFG